MSESETQIPILEQILCNLGVPKTFARNIVPSVLINDTLSQGIDFPASDGLKVRSDGSAPNEIWKISITKQKGLGPKATYHHTYISLNDEGNLDFGKKQLPWEYFSIFKGKWEDLEPWFASDDCPNNNYFVEIARKAFGFPEED